MIPTPSRHLLRVTLLVAVMTPAHAISPEAIDQARAELQRAVDTGEIAGGSHLVFWKGKIVHRAVVGVCDNEDQRPLQADTIVRMYSMTKPITSVAAMILYEQGRFQLDDPVASYIPAFDHATVMVPVGDGHEIVPANRPITVRDVFRHSTGYSYGNEPPQLREYYEREGMRYRPPHGMLPPDMTIEQAAEALARIPAAHQPGERFTYGFNTDLLGRLIEIWSGVPLDEFLHKNLFVPLEMIDAGFSVPPDRRDRFASCHTLEDGALVIADKAAHSPYLKGFQFVSGGGGLVSTLQDYANFCQMLIDGGVFKDRRLLKEENVRLMFTDQLTEAEGDFRFGLGFAISKVTLGAGEVPRSAMQYAWGGYASTDFRLVPEEGMYQIILRQKVPSNSGFSDRLFRIIYDGLPPASP